MTNYEWLLNMSGEERQAWFDAEHVENQNGTLDGARAALDDENDSREKLEADVLKFSQVYYTSHLLVYDKVIELLDRQAAITENEIGGVLLNQDERIAEMQERVDELQAENDALLAAHADDVERLDAMGEGELQAQVDELTAERDKAARESELYRARVSDLLDAIQEAWRVGNLDYSVVDMDGEVVS